MPPDDMYADDEKENDMQEMLKRERTVVPKFLLFVRRFGKTPFWARCQLYALTGAIILFIPGIVAIVQRKYSRVLSAYRKGILDIIFELQMPPGGMIQWSSGWQIGGIPLTTWYIFFFVVHGTESS